MESSVLRLFLESINSYNKFANIIELDTMSFKLIQSLIFITKNRQNADAIILTQNFREFNTFQTLNIFSTDCREENDNNFTKNQQVFLLFLDFF